MLVLGGILKPSGDWLVCFILEFNFELITRFRFKKECCVLFRFFFFFHKDIGYKQIPPIPKTVWISSHCRFQTLQGTRTSAKPSIFSTFNLYILILWLLILGYFKHHWAVLYRMCVLGEKTGNVL